MARSLEALFGRPQDIEFAVADNAVHLLQSRPITTRAAEDAADWEEGLDTSYTWTLSRMTFFLEGPMYRLQLDSGLAYVDGLRQCYEETASDFSHNHIIHVMNGYFYIRSPDEDSASIVQRQERHAAKCRAYIDQGTTNYQEEMVPRIQQIHKDLRRLARAGTSIPARVKYLEACIEAAGLSRTQTCSSRPFPTAPPGWWPAFETSPDWSEKTLAWPRRSLTATLRYWNIPHTAIV